MKFRVHIYRPDGTEGLLADSSDTPVWEGSKELAHELAAERNHVYGPQGFRYVVEETPTEEKP